MKKKQIISNNNKQLFRPLFRYVLAKKIVAQDKKSKGGIILTEKHENKLSHTNKAEIVAVGSRAFEYESVENRPLVGDIIAFTRYEDFIIEHTTEYSEDEYCMIYDEFVTAVEVPINNKGDK